jgi:hypothetical protein
MVANLADFSWLPAFRPQVNRQFSPPTFPREPKFISRVESFAYLQRQVFHKKVIIDYFLESKYDEFSLLLKVKQMIQDIPEKMRDLEGLLVSNFSVGTL